MQVASMYFKERAHVKLHDAQLQYNLTKIKDKFVEKRRSAITELDDFEATRNSAREIRQRALDDLDVWLTIFEENARARGATVLYAQSPADVNALVLEIARRHDVTKIIKSKSMVSEESALDHAIESAGLTVVETDLGEYILQINNYEPPSHIIGPALHKSRDEVADLFHKRHGKPRKEGIDELCLEARAELRAHYLTADMGISGGNFFIAETGSVAIVTNEGNATLTTTLPKVHVAISGIEKIVPTLEDFATLMRLLPRSATGQSISNYVDVLTGTKGPGEFNGAEHMYFILVDSGRSQVLGSDVRDALRCIRCGACMNHCPVYQNVGGHSYGWARGLEIAFIDVGQGDAVAIQTPAGRWLLVDAGPADEEFDAGQRRVLPWLRAHGARRIEALVLTHPHVDHVGGAPAVLREMPVGRLIDPGLAFGTPMYAGVLRAAETRHVPWNAARQGRVLRIDGVELEFLWPTADVLDAPEDANDISAVVQLRYGEFSALLTGDAPQFVEHALVSRYGGALRSQLAKAGHHGSRTATSGEWLRAVHPALVVISCGRRNKYGHPAPETMERLRADHVPVARTDEDGTVVVHVSPGGRAWSREEG